MYDFVFCYIYIQQLKKGKSAAFARYNGSLIASLALLIHVMLLYAILKRIFLNWYIEHIGTIGKSSIIILVAVFMLLVFFYYNQERTKKINDRYSERIRSKSVVNGIKVAIILGLPLLVSILISTQS